MTPKQPKKSNFTYTGYEHPTVGAIQDLSVVRAGDGAIYSAWKPNWRECLDIVLGRLIVVGVLTDRQPPMAVVVGEDMIPSQGDGN